jgi:hypothetical protein
VKPNIVQPVAANVVEILSSDDDDDDGDDGDDDSDVSDEDVEDSNDFSMTRLYSSCF